MVLETSERSDSCLSLQTSMLLIQVSYSGLYTYHQSVSQLAGRLECDWKDLETGGVRSF